MRPEILVVDDEQPTRTMLKGVLERAGMTAIEAEEGKAGLKHLRRRPPDVMLLDMCMPGEGGFEILCQALAIDRTLPVIIMTAFAEVSDAVRCIRAGAYDYIEKPFRAEDLITLLKKAVAEHGPRCDIILDETTAEQQLPLVERMGRSAAIRLLDAETARVAPTGLSVLVVGETGSGKEVVAQAIRNASERSGDAFIALDCGAIPETLIESELFGHEKGAFTGADRRKCGKLEEAAGGTLFLDEISNLPLQMQSKLLRVLQERCFYRIGGNMAIRTDIRVVAATNRELLGPASNFRADLYYRLAEYVLRVPPLRERKEDIPFLADRFMRRANEALRKSTTGVSQEAMQLMMAHDWPGNVRELRNVVQRAVLMADGVIEPRHLGPQACVVSGALPLLQSAGKPQAAPEAPCPTPVQLQAAACRSLKEMLDLNLVTVETAIIRQVLVRTGGNKAAAARLLQVDYKTLHTKVKKYGLELRLFAGPAAGPPATGGPPGVGTGSQLLT